MWRGDAHRGKGNYDRATAGYDQEISNHNARKSDSTGYAPFFPGVYKSRGNLYKNKGDYDRAISDYEGLIRVQPKDADAYSARGEALEAKSDLDHAMADFEHALKLDPSLEAAQRGRKRVQAVLAKGK